MESSRRGRKSNTNVVSTLFLFCFFYWPMGWEICTASATGSFRDSNYGETEFYSVEIVLPIQF